MAGPETAGRRDRVIRSLREAALEYLLVTHRANVRYLTGFSGSSGWLLVGPERPVLVTDPRYAEQGPAQAPDCDVVVSEGGLIEGLAEVGSGLEHAGYEAAHLTCGALGDLQAALPGTRWTAATGHVEGERLRKDANEVDAVRRALRVAEAALCEVAPTIVPGMREVEIAARLEYACRVRGAERMSFDTIVAAGEHGALPHAEPGARRVVAGDLLVVDMGCVIDGYCSDITRCLVIGEQLSSRWQGIHRAVAAAQDAAIASIRAGVPASKPDAAARDVLAGHGLAEAFVHGLGHGVGLEIHEGPRLSSRSPDHLLVGSVVTIEPGVYLPDEGGMRLENLVVVTEQGCERLNELSSQPIWCGVAVE